MVSVIGVILTVFIEWLRIKAVKGKVQNINKLITYTIGLCCFLICSVFDKLSGVEYLLYAFYFACVRGVIYDPLLNVLRGLRWDYKSATTNSKLDKLLKPVPFLALRLVYLLLAIFFYYLISL